LTKLQTTEVLDRLARHPEYQDRFGLIYRLAKWLSQKLSDEIKDAAIEALIRGISSLDMHSWDTTGGKYYDPSRFFLFSLMYWLLTNHYTDASARVFWRGLKFMNTQRIERTNRVEPQIQSEALQAFEKLEPIITRVPSSILRQAIASGKNIDDPIVRGLVRLFVV
jgi:hypothetical protein